MRDFPPINVVFSAEAGYLLAGEIGSVVEDDSVGNLEATYYVLPEELDNCCPLISESGIASIHLVK